MKYVLLVYREEKATSDADRQDCYEKSIQFARDLHASGKYLDASPLHPVSTATSVRVRDGKRLIIDGPFAETREQLGGFWLVDAQDIDEAIAMAERLPVAAVGTIEIRPVFEMPGLPGSRETHPDMARQDYTKVISAKISAKEAADRIGRVADWWTKGFTGTARKNGDAFTVRFGETFVDFKISEVIPERRIVWEVINSNLHWVSDKAEWNGTRIVWDISTRDETTTVRMTHVGLHPGVECYERCAAGWDSCFGEGLLKLLNEPPACDFVS